MTTRTHRIACSLLALTTTLVLPACEDAASVGDDVQLINNGSNPGAANSPAAGHWFFCETDDCSVLDKDGIGLLGDGSFAWLDATEGDTLEPGAGFCLEADDRDWTWSWADGELQIGGEGGQRLIDFAVDGDRALFKPAGEPGEAQPMKRVDAAGLTGDCPAGPVAATTCPLDAEAWGLMRTLAAGWTNAVNASLANDSTYLKYPQLFDGDTWSSYDYSFQTCPDSLGGGCSRGAGTFGDHGLCKDWTCGAGDEVSFVTWIAGPDADPQQPHPIEYTLRDGAVVRFARNPSVTWELHNPTGGDRRVDADIAMQVEVEGPSGTVHDFDHTGTVAIEEDRTAGEPRELAIELSFPDLVAGQLIELSVSLDAQKKATGTITADGATVASFTSGQVWLMRDATWSGVCAD